MIEDEHLTDCPECGRKDAYLSFDDHPYGMSYAREIHGITCEDCGDLAYCWICGDFCLIAPEGHANPKCLHDDEKHERRVEAENVHWVNQGVREAPDAFSVLMDGHILSASKPSKGVVKVEGENHAEISLDELSRRRLPVSGAADDLEGDDACEAR